MTQQPSDHVDPPVDAHQPWLARTRDALATLPPVNPRAVANIMSAIAHDQPSRLTRWRHAALFMLEQWSDALSPSRRLLVVGITATALGFVARSAFTPPASVATAVTASTSTTPSTAGSATSSAPAATVAATNEGATTISVPVQFVLDARTVPNATTVHLVGDFNDWQRETIPMTRDGGVWTVTTTLAPGRHVYAFVVDGTQWIADPRQPAAADADFGRAGSVIIVQAP